MSRPDSFITDEQLLHCLAETRVATAIHVTEDAVIQMANSVMLKIWGKDSSVIGKSLEDALPELKGQPFIDLFKRVWNEGITISGTDTAADLIIDGVLKTFYFDFEYRAIKDANGKTLCILHTAIDITENYWSRQREQNLSQELAASNEELAASNEELTSLNEEMITINEELRESQEQLMESHKQLAKSQDELKFAIDAAGLGTWDLNPVTNRFSGNDLLKSWFGLQPGVEIELQKATDAILEEDRSRVKQSIARALDYITGGVYDEEYTIINPITSTPRIVKAKGKAMFNEQKEPVRFSGTLQDITEQKQDEQRKNDFIGMVSHELKTPLTSMKAYIELLHSKAQKNEDTFAAGALSKANNQVKKMTGLINGFLNVSRLEAGKINLNRERLDLCALMKEAIDDITLTTSTYQINFSHNEPIFVDADADKISQVINNFLSNAIKYSPNNKTIEVTCNKVNNSALVSVKDGGIGIMPQDVDKLFDRFYRVESQATKTISGFGIGLYLCAEIINRHDGNIWVESNYGNGSVFYFSLPLLN